MKNFAELLKDTAAESYAQGWESGWNAARTALKTADDPAHEGGNGQPLPSLHEMERWYDWHANPQPPDVVSPADLAFLLPNNRPVTIEE